MATETVENYLKAIYALGRESPAGEAGMTRIAAVLGVTTGTATSMIKRLADAGFVRYRRFGGVSLTPRGKSAALDILRRHRLLETFLVRTLGLDWSVVHAEAERLEHALSPRVLEALDRHLGRPEFDPHGDPIPDTDGSMPRPRARPLSACRPGERCRIARVLDQREETLRFLRRHRLEIGARLAVHAHEPGAGTIVVRVGRGRRVSLSEDAARRILVEVGPRHGTRAGPRHASRRTPRPHA
jgi:DtxR family Mn-dependent transcriptional regulator